MKKLFALILVFAMVLGLAACAPAANTETTPPAGETTETTTAVTADSQEKMQFSVIVVHGDTTEEIFLYETEGGMLGTILEEDGLIESEGADDGMFHTVDGEKADWNENQSYWAFYVDNEYAMTGIYDTPAENGTNYKLVYTIG